MKVVWDDIKTIVKTRLPNHSYRMWIDPIQCLESKEDQLVLSCPNSFSKRRVLDNYAQIIEEELENAGGHSLKVKFKVSDGTGRVQLIENNHMQLPLPNLNLRPHSGRLLRKDFTFEDFVVGGNSDLAYSASLSLASGRRSQQSTLFLLSATGMGKSHLTQAVGRHILTEHPSERVYYITAEDFTNEMVQAFRHDTIDRFKEKYRSQCDVLLLEDVQFLSGKERTQIELALTLDTLIDSGRKIIFSSSYPPTEIPKLKSELRSRLACGLISTIEKPDFNTRVRILKKKVQRNGYHFPDDVILYLAGELTENVRQLEGGMIGLAAKSSLLGSPIDVQLAETVVKTMVRRGKSITIDAIKKLVCRHHHISEADLVSRSRKKSIVKPRQLAIFLARKYTDQSLQSIGRSFNRYHATALHAIACVEKGMREDSQLRRQVEFLCQKLEPGKF